jgi:hypothetical protein
MGTTEESIVYQLLSTIRASELSNDETITERRLRSFLRTHRAEAIYKNTAKGLLASDEYFQEIEVGLIQINTREWVTIVPEIIQLPDNFGIKFLTAGFTNIPVIGEEYYHLSKKNIINKHLPAAKIEGLKLTLRLPEISPYAMNGGSNGESLIDCIKRNNDSMRLKVILDNPDDQPGYDWTTSPYPVPNELIQTIKDSIFRKELSITLETKSDQVPNMKNDTLRYHDQGKVQQ